VQGTTICSVQGEVLQQVRRDDGCVSPAQAAYLV
jgi:hypothetical protein